MTTTVVHIYTPRTYSTRVLVWGPKFDPYLDLTLIIQDPK